jgi:tetratricopeptide (TPR) repeat protein
MPPEQAGAKAVKAGRYSDVYSLGGILFYLVTGRPPFVAETVAETLYHVLNTEPVSPRLLNPSVPQDIATICLKCLEKEPGKRFETAQQLADELNHFLNDEPIHARPVSRVERLWGWGRRRPAMVSAITVTIVALGTAGLFAVRARHVEERRLGEKKQSAVEKALLTAWSGDPDATETAIREAELAGAAGGDVRMLRGQAAFHRGEYGEAVQQLEQAVTLRPGSVAEQSMLFMAFPRMGRWEDADRALQAVSQLQAVTPEDYLFKGLAESDWDPDRALLTLNEAIRRRPTGITRLCRANVRANQAMQSGSATAAEGAMADAIVAKEILPGNLEALTTSLLAHLVAASAYQETGQVEKRAAALAHAATDAAALYAYPRNATAVLARMRYLRFLGERDTALKELRQAALLLRHPHVDSHYALALYEVRDFSAAYDVSLRASRGSGDSADFIRGFIVAELTNGPARAWEEFLSLSKRPPAKEHAIQFQTILRLLGRKHDAVAACLELRTRPGSLPPWRNGWWERVLDYNCDLLSSDEFVKVAGSSRWSQCQAHYFVAMSCLADGDRVSAQNHFRAALNTHAFDLFEFDWSGAFLARLDRDSNWPPWIPAKPQP